MKSSEQIDQLAAALAAAQGEFAPVAKNREVNAGSRRYKYAELSEIVASVRAALAKQKLAILQLTFCESEALMLNTRLTHASGQWIESVYPVAALNAAHQAIGSALTYARRYSLSALLGIVTEDDDDGEAAAAPRAPLRNTETQHRPDAEVTVARLKASIDALPDLDFLEKWPVVHDDTLRALPERERNMVRMHYKARKLLLSGGVSLAGANGHDASEALQ